MAHTFSDRPLGGMAAPPAGPDTCAHPGCPAFRPQAPPQAPRWLPGCPGGRSLAGLGSHGVARWCPANVLVLRGGGFLRRRGSLWTRQEPWDRCGRRGVAAQRSLPSPPHLSRGRAGLSGSRAPGPGRPGTRACPCPSWRAVGAPAAFLPVRSPFQGCCGRLWSSICLWSGYLVCR